MATQYLTLDEVMNYKLSNGTTADLVHLIGIAHRTLGRDGWDVPASVSDVVIGDTAYVYAMGEYRRGVVSKITRAKIGVTFTTGATVRDARNGKGYYDAERRPILARVQTTMVSPGSPNMLIKVKD